MRAFGTHTFVLLNANPEVPATEHVFPIVKVFVKRKAYESPG